MPSEQRWCNQSLILNDRSNLYRFVMATLRRMQAVYTTKQKRHSKAHALLPIRRQREPNRRIPTTIIQNRQRQNSQRQRRPINHPRARSHRHQLRRDLLQPGVCFVLSRERPFWSQASDGRVGETSWEASHHVHIEEHLCLHDDPRGTGESGS